jgi:tetratricopeptide (TPR) repeat protein
MAPTVPEFDAPHASVLMKRGIALLTENTPASLRESLVCFDRAIEIRRALLTAEDDWMGYVLAASWMNRGDALTRLGTVENLAAAVRSYDAALAVLDGLPTGENALYRRRLGVAWMNRGLTLHEQGTPASLAEAVASFERGIKQLRDIPDQQIALASAWANRANSLLRLEPPRALEAQESAATALATLHPLEETDLAAAEAGLKARYFLCQAIAHDPSAPAVELALQSAGQGLKLARAWEDRGERGFAGFQTGLFRFGVIACQKFRPESLVEFITAHLREDATPENLQRYEAAITALTETWHGSLREGFAPVNSPDFNLLLTTLQSLRASEARLRALRS